MKREAVLRGDGGEICLEIIDGGDPLARDIDDAKWLRANLRIKAGPFSGNFELGIMTEELAFLGDQLRAKLEVLSGTIDFATVEGNWSLDLRFERTGAVLVSGKVTQNPAIDNTLYYEFYSDPITLESLVQDLRFIIGAYPTTRSLHGRLIGTRSI